MSKVFPAARFILLVFAVSLVACSEPAPERRESFVFGTRVELLVAEADAKKADLAMTAVLADFDRLHRAYHAWEPSELTALNADLAAGNAHEVSPELGLLLLDAVTLSKQSGGGFDPGIGTLVRLWGFQSDTFLPALPDEKALEQWRRAPAGIADLVVDGRRVQSARHNLAFDFGGYLKGVALDRAAMQFKAAGIDHALINIGGNVLALGNKYGTPWRVGIQHPRRPGALAVLDLGDGEAIGTSGDYQRYFEIGGRRYSHILNPHTAAPAMHTQSLSILVTPRAAPAAEVDTQAGTQVGTRSDALSKPLFIAGSEWPLLARRLAPLGVAGILRVDATGRIEANPEMARRITLIDEEEKLQILETKE